MSIGIKIKCLRKEKGMTLQQIADIMGCSPQLVSQYESGKRIPKVETIQKIADALKVDWKIFIAENYVEKREQEIDALLSQSEAIKMVGNTFDDPYAENMLLAYSLLNKRGKKEAFNRVEELTEIKRYTKKEE